MSNGKICTLYLHLWGENFFNFRAFLGDFLGQKWGDFGGFLLVFIL